VVQLLLARQQPPVVDSVWRRPMLRGFF
jgi:hypothetical protein